MSPLALDENLNLVVGQCPLLALSGHFVHPAACPLSGVKRTSPMHPPMSAYDPGCVKTFMGCNFGEMTSPLRPFQINFQHVSELNGWNAERTSKRLDRVDVFTQPGPKADIHMSGDARARCRKVIAEEEVEGDDHEDQCF